MNIELCNTMYCSGCGLCAYICPQSAIEMKPNSEGFRYPCIDEQKCVECGLCHTTCPINNVSSSSCEITGRAFAGYSKCTNTLLNCSSGGVASHLASKFISEGGIVFGVKYASDFTRTVYDEIDSIKELSAISKSKYAETDRSELFKKLPMALKTGKQVLVIGLPCDISAVRILVGYPPNMFVCELCCMATTSQKALKQYVEQKESENKSDIEELDLRNKQIEFPAFPSWIRIKYKSGVDERDLWTNQDLYKAFFILNRESCSNCIYKNDFSKADLKVGDFQGISSKEEYYNSLGVSLIIPITQRGMECLLSLNDFYLKEVDYEKSVSYNWMFTSKYPRYFERDAFSMDFVRYGLHYACSQLVLRQRGTVISASRELERGDRRVLIWGCGLTLKSFEEIVNISKWNIVACFDSSLFKVGTVFMGMIVEDISKIIKYKEKADVVVSFIPTSSDSELDEVLLENGWSGSTMHLGKYKFIR